MREIASSQVNRTSIVNIGFSSSHAVLRRVDDHQHARLSFDCTWVATNSGELASTTMHCRAAISTQAGPARVHSYPSTTRNAGGPASSRASAEAFGQMTSDASRNPLMACAAEVGCELPFFTANVHRRFPTVSGRLRLIGYEGTMHPHCGSDANGGRRLGTGADAHG
jgi:hypothetical protein